MVSLINLTHVARNKKNKKKKLKQTQVGAHFVPHRFKFHQHHSVHPPGSPHPAHITSSQSHLCSHHLSLPRLFTPDLKLISFTNPFLHNLPGSFWTVFTDLEPVRHEVGTDLCLFQFLLFIFFCFWLRVQCFTSPPTQYRLYGRRFLQVKRPNEQYQKTEGDAAKEKENNENN